MWEKRYFLRINNLYQIDVQTSSGGGTSASRICTRRTFLAMYQLSNFDSQRILLFVKEKFVKEEKGSLFTTSNTEWQLGTKNDMVNLHPAKNPYPSLPPNPNHISKFCSQTNIWKWTSCYICQFLHKKGWAQEIHKVDMDEKDHMEH